MDDETDESLSTLSGDIETEIKEMMGLFDVPAVRAARPGARGDAPPRSTTAADRRRGERLDMVRVRLRQWARVATGPGRLGRRLRRADRAALAPSARPSRRSGPPRRPRVHRQLAVARDLIAAVERFNRRWVEFLERLNLDPANAVIDQYNRYYVLEKECVLGSARLAARFFTPVPPLTPDRLLRDHPLLPVPIPDRLIDWPPRGVRLA